MLELSTAHMKTLVLTTNSGKVCRQKEKGLHLRWVAQHLSRSCIWPSSIFGLPGKHQQTGHRKQNIPELPRSKLYRAIRKNFLVSIFYIGSLKERGTSSTLSWDGAPGLCNLPNSKSHGRYHIIQGERICPLW